MHPPSETRAGVLNAHLWARGRIPPIQAHAIARIDEALAACNNTLPVKGMVLYKGVHAINFKGWRVGSVRHIPAFSSSTKSLHRALNYGFSPGDKKGCILKLSFDKRSPVRYFSSSFEEEVVLERDICFKLLSRRAHVCGSECQHTGFAKSEQMAWKGAKVTMLDVLVHSSASAQR